jgi:hypothetical protein
MAIRLEFINLIIPIQKINEKYPGGWDQCFKDHQSALGGRVWHDDHLFRDGAMSPHAMGVLIDHWSAMGFDAAIERDGKKAWSDDMCACEALAGGPTAPCDWIVFDPNNGSVYLKGTEPGETVVPKR